MIQSVPYTWPFDGNLTLQNTALIVIDMQTDFCGYGGYVDKMGYDLSLTRAPIEPIKHLLKISRELGIFIIHTREGHRPDLSDLPENKHSEIEEHWGGYRRRGSLWKNFSAG
jgi:nicotinamidase-related amidase